MPKSAYSAIGGILFALTVLPALVNSFDCEKFVNPPPPGGNTCALGAIGDGLVGYSIAWSLHTASRRSSNAQAKKAFRTSRHKT